MNQFAPLLKVLEKIEAAAQKQDWAAVDREAPAVEQTLAELNNQLEIAALSEAERQTFKSARAIHARVVELATRRQQALKQDLSKIDQGKKAQRAYGRGKP